ncbi:MAG TPA: hypothetical protein VND64_34600 [Pirellulales bacterium]|nr:hypothetical protein [Pirellulales bacterium]
MFEDHFVGQPLKLLPDFPKLTVRGVEVPAPYRADLDAGDDAEQTAALEASRLPPKEDFARMVREGLINARGELTKLVGGDAEPEAGAQRPTLSRAANSTGDDAAD